MALVIVLAFVVLLSGLVMAFLSRSVSERQGSNSSASLSKVDLFAQGAVDTIIGDLKQEIVDGSTSNSTGSSTIYTPKSPVNAVPSLVGSSGTNGLENLLKCSVSGQAFYSGQVICYWHCAGKQRLHKFDFHERPQFQPRPLE
jgi:hypothetical protein